MYIFPTDLVARGEWVGGGGWERVVSVHFTDRVGSWGSACVWAGGAGGGVVM